MFGGVICRLYKKKKIFICALRKQTDLKMIFENNHLCYMWP